MLPIEEAAKGLKLLINAGMRKVNFAGGEPFLYPRYLGELVRYCKEDLHMESVTVVTNGSLVKERWLQQYGKNLDIMAVSCDLFDEKTNMMIGRGKGNHLETFVKLSELCREYNVKFKVNTVVCRYNIDEDMNAMIEKVAPFRWKCFQVLVVEGENDSSNTLRLILDEYMRFLNKGVKEPTKSILEIGVPAAMNDVYWDDESSTRRGGEYDWQKEEKKENTELDF
ncbi:MAG: hypothetical protein Q9221_004261 [Calogaya cf. arnoldii]